MNEVWEIAQFVEGHPDNVPQRWRLAKKLYMAWEYRLALEHLQILKNEWPDKQNVRRYLAATYYRLDRYEDALEELRGAIERWPDHEGILEQLARTLDTTGDKLQASEIWERIRELNPEHRIAAKAAQKLREQALGGDGRRPADTSVLARSTVDSVVHEVRCPSCGTRNGPEFRHCWQCNALLSDRPAQPEVEEVPSRLTEILESLPLTSIGGLVFVSMLAASVYLTLKQLFPGPEIDNVAAVSTSMHEFFIRDLILTRLIVGVSLLIAWPIVIAAGAPLVRHHDLSIARAMVVGGIAALLAYLLSWMPAGWGPLMLWAPVLLSLLLTVTWLGMDAKRGVALWLLQLSVLALVVLTTLIARHGLAVVTEFSAMRAFASDSMGQSIYTRATVTPTDLNLSWKSTGSAWLDESAPRLGVILHVAPHQDRVFLEIRQNAKTLEFLELAEGENRTLVQPVKPGAPIQLSLSGQDNVDISIDLRGLYPIAVDRGEK